MFREDRVDEHAAAHLEAGGAADARDDRDVPVVVLGGRLAGGGRADGKVEIGGAKAVAHAPCHGADDPGEIVDFGVGDRVEAGVVAARKYPLVVGREGGVGNEGDKVARGVENAVAGGEFVGEDPAENTLAGGVVVTNGFLDAHAHLGWNDGRRDHLGVGVFEGSSCADSLVAKEGDALDVPGLPESGVAPPVNAKKAGDVIAVVGGQRGVVEGVFDDDFVVPGRSHALEGPFGFAVEVGVRREGGVLVGDDADRPGGVLLAGAVNFRGGEVLGAGAEGAVGAVCGKRGGRGRGGKVVGLGGPVAGHDDPVVGDDVEAEMGHGWPECSLPRGRRQHVFGRMMSLVDLSIRRAVGPLEQGFRGEGCVLS